MARARGDVCVRRCIGVHRSGRAAGTQGANRLRDPDGRDYRGLHRHARGGLNRGRRDPQIRGRCGPRDVHGDAPRGARGSGRPRNAGCAAGRPHPGHRRIPAQAQHVGRRRIRDRAPVPRREGAARVDGGRSPCKRGRDAGGSGPSGRGLAIPECACKSAPGVRDRRGRGQRCSPDCPSADEPCAPTRGPVGCRPHRPVSLPTSIAISPMPASTAPWRSLS